MAYYFVGENRERWESTKGAHLRLTKINSGGNGIVTLSHR